MGVQVTVLGSSGTYAREGNACSGYLIESGGYRVLVDCGPGTLANLQAHSGLLDLDAIILSHAHGDHWLELPVLCAAYAHVFGREGLTVLGGADHLSTVERLMGDVRPTLFWQVIADAEEATLGPLRFRFSRTDHPTETLAMRISDDASAVGYSADTGPGWSLNELGRGLDLAIVEATYLDGDRTEPNAVHLTAWQAGALGRLADVGHLALTHLLPSIDLDAARAEGSEAFGAPVHMALPHLRFDL